MAKQILARKHSHKKRCNKWQTFSSQTFTQKDFNRKRVFFKICICQKMYNKKNMSINQPGYQATYETWIFGNKA